MNRLPLYAFILALGVALTLFVIRRIDNAETRASLEDISQEENKELFPITSVDENQAINQGFDVGTSYLFIDGSSKEEKVYLREEVDELGTRAVFKDSEGEESSFYSNVLFSLKEESFSKEIEREIKDNEDIVEYKTFDVLNMFAVSFESPYQAYIHYLSLIDDERLMGVGLDMRVSPSSVGAGVQIQ